MQFPKHLCTGLSNVFAFCIRSAASPATAYVLSLQETLHQSFLLLQPIRFKISSHLFIWASSKTFCYQGPCKMDRYTLPCEFGLNSNSNTCMYEFDTSWILSYVLQCSSRQFKFYLSVPQFTYLLGNRRISTKPVQQTITA